MALFFSTLGAGSSLRVITSMTFLMASDSTVQGGGQIIIPCGGDAGGIIVVQKYTRAALLFMKQEAI